MRVGEQLRAATLDLGDPAGPLGLQRPDGPLELAEIVEQLPIGAVTEVLELQLVERGAQRAHARDAIGPTFRAL